MPTDLASYFAEQTQKQNSNSSDLTSSNSAHKAKKANNVDNGDADDDMGPSVSMAVQADDDDSFQKSTFNLKRTRSMGLFDDYIDPTKKLLGKADEQSNDEINEQTKKNVSNNSNDNACENEDDDYDEEYNSDDSSSLGSNDSYDANGSDDGAGLQRYDSATGNVSLSPSVSPPSADNDNFLLPQDDNDLMREPERHVDYLSHEWNESEISNSWKYIILKKKKKTEDLINAARLENASWRTWAKARNHLKTVSPEVVNWSKDSDVTWLYGPIVRGSDGGKGENTELGYGSDDETSKRLTASTKSKKKKKKASRSSSSSASATPKPILKKRSVTEIIEENALWKLNEARKHMNDIRHASGKYQDDYDDYDALAAKVNAQYYSSSSQHDHEDAGEKYGTADAQVNNSISSPTPKDVNVPHVAEENEDDSANNSGNQLTKGQIEDHEDQNHNSSNAELSGILSSSNYKKAGTTCKDPAKNRHIHFNDRVEQCMAIGRTFSDDDASDSEEEDSGSSERHLADADGFLKPDDGSSEATMHVEDKSNYSSDTDGDGADDDYEDEDDAGLFINPTMSRRTDSNSHYSVTDTSSQSSTQSKHTINPIIKLLPATTLNYGSDDEASDNSDFNGSYGNAVSHNVNTYRGYDYMYDYNSVYTGDTSSFLPVDNCDIVDLPEGLNLHSAMAADNASNYELNHTISPSPDKTLSNPVTHKNRNVLSSDAETASLDSGDQFIENSVNLDSDEEEADEEDQDAGPLSLKRSVSFGKEKASHSLRDLTKNASLMSINSATPAKSFISGKPLDVFDQSGKTKDTSDEAPTPPLSSVKGSSAISRPRVLKRNSSLSNFIFDSDSDDNSDGEDSMDKNDSIGIAQSQQVGKGALASGVNQKSTLPSLRDNCIGGPPQSTVITPSLASDPSDPSDAPSALPPASDVSKTFIIKKPSSHAAVGSSDVAISGSFSPSYGSAKSIASKKDSEGQPTTKDLHEVKKNLETCHIDENANETNLDHSSANGGSNESLQKMMQNARDIAHKYLHSWKRTDGKRETRKRNPSNHT